jgi:UDP-GlcNAc:undecaprenyl-phosphate GlcNAc-1-phosphate transferase
MLTAILRRLAPTIGMVDCPDARKDHARCTPLLGGVGVSLAAMISYALFMGMDARTVWLIAGAFAVLALGVWDDRVGLRARLRLGIQVFGAGGIVAAGVSFHWFGWWLVDSAVSIVWLVGLTNAMNCMDCADGTAGGVATLAAVAFAVIAFHQGHYAVAMMSVGVVGACLGFLALNFPPASIFLGDAGSNFLGLLLGGIAMNASRSLPPVYQAWVAALPVAVPVWDIVLVHARRYRAGTRDLRVLLESTSRDHLPHRLRVSGLSPRQVACAVYVMAGAYAALACVVAFKGATACATAVAAALAGMLVGERPFGQLVASVARVPEATRLEVESGPRSAGVVSALSHGRVPRQPESEL